MGWMLRFGQNGPSRAVIHPWWGVMYPRTLVSSMSKFYHPSPQCTCARVGPDMGSLRIWVKSGPENKAAFLILKRWVKYGPEDTSTSVFRTCQRCLHFWKYLLLCYLSFFPNMVTRYTNTGSDPSSVLVCRTPLALGPRC